MGRGAEFLILVLLAVVLLGAKRLPGTARALGESLHIFKKALRGNKDQPAAATVQPTVIVVPDPHTSAGRDGVEPPKA